MVRISYFVTVRQIKTLRKLAKDTDMKVAEHIRRALDEYLAKKVKGYNDAVNT
jgi:hypothetical protein